MSDFEGKSYIELRKKILKDELGKLTQEGYISPYEMHHIVNSQEHFYSGAITPKQQYATKIVKQEEKHEPNLKQPKVKTKDWYQSLILILGVILVLISGIIFATTTWNSLFKNNIVKIAYLSLGSILFYVASILAEKKLKIEKTGFTFWVLGSLYIPILILSIGYFKLFGYDLSIFGKFKYLFGFYGALFCIPIYFYSVNKYKSQFFTWLAFLLLSTAGVLIGIQLKESFNSVLLSIGILNLILFISRKSLKIKNFDLFEKISHLYPELTLYLLNFLMIINLFQKIDTISLFFYIIMLMMNLYISYSNKNSYLGYLTFPIIIIITNNLILLYSNYGVLSKEQLSILFVVTLISNFVLYGLNKNKYFIYSKYGTLYTTLLSLGIIFIYALTSEYYTLNAVFMFISITCLYLIYKNETDDLLKSSCIILIYLLQFGAGLQIYDFLNQHFYMSDYYHLGIHASVVLFVLFIETIYLFKTNRKIGNLFFILTNIYLVVLFVVIESIKFSSSKNFLIYYVIMITITAYYFLKPKQVIYFISHLKQVNIPLKIFHISYLYSSLIILTPLIFHVINYYSLDKQYYNPFVYIAFVTLGLYFMFKQEYKKYLFAFFIIYSFIGSLYSYTIILDITRELRYYNMYFQFITSGLRDSYHYFLIQALYIFVLFIASVIISHKIKIFHFLNIGLFFLTIVSNLTVNSIYLYNKMDDYDAVISNNLLLFTHVLLGMILFILGVTLFKKVIEGSKKDWVYARVDYYLVFAFVNLMVGYSYTTELWHRFLIDGLIVALIFYQLRRTDKRFVYTIGGYYLLVPYIRFIVKVVKVNDIIKDEIIYIPIIVITAILVRLLWKNQYKYAQYFEWVVITTTMFILLIDVFQNDLIDAILFGVISAGMIIYGFYGKIKSQFFVGGIYLLILITYETDKLARDMNSLLPWFGYLFTTGLLLIIVGSLSEFRNQEGRKKENVFKAIFSKFNKWE